MANVLLGYPIYSDAGSLYTPTLSGGSWSGTLPLINLQDRRLAKVARSSAATKASTQFDIDLKAARRVGVLAIPKHTISQAGSIRMRSWATVLPFLDNYDMSGWTTVNATSRVAASLVGSDGVALDKIGDTDGANFATFNTVPTFTGDGQKVVYVRVSKDTSTGFGIYLQETAGPTDRLRANITWTGTVPTVAMLTGTLVRSTLVATGVYLLVFLTTTITAANAHKLYVEPANNTAPSTGTVYMGDVQLINAATDQLVYDSGYAAAWPANVYPAGSLNTGDTRSGAGYTAEEALSVTPSFTHLPTVASVYTPQTARYWRIEIADAANAAGYVDLARLVIADSYIPTTNMSYGATLGWSSATTRTETDGGAFFAQAKPRRRSCSFVLDNVALDEALANVFELQRRIGTSEQLYFVFDPSDTYHITRRAFLATLDKINPLTFPYPVRNSVPVSVIEEL